MTSVTTTICDAQGRAMDASHELLSVDIEREVGRVPRCNLALIDGDIAKGSFPISDDALFKPGAEVTVKLRREGKGESDAVVFQGVVVRHKLDLSRTGSILRVELRDRAVALTQPRRSAVHVEATDAAVIRKLAEAAGLRAGKVVATRPKHAHLVQYQATDWDFIVARAEAQGLVFSVTDGEFSLTAPAAVGGATHGFTLGQDEIYELELEADGLQQVAGVSGRAWDLAEKAQTDAVVAPPARGGPGNLDGAAVAKALGFAETRLAHPPVERDELKAWVEGRMVRSRMAMVRGRLGTRGFAGFKLLDAVELAKMGARFNGRSVVTGIRHRVTTRGWQTDLQLGFSADLFARRADVMETPSAGLLPPVHGLQIGVVAAFDEDPQHASRVKVVLPAIDGEAGAAWARLATPGAGPNRGMVFRPEPGDEVVVGFFHDDPRQAVILGALHGARNPAHEAFGAPSEANIFKGIVSRKGVKLVFVDDDKAKLQLETPGGNSVVLDDDGECVKLADSHGNTITLGKDGVTIRGKKVTIDAGSDGSVIIKGKDVNVQ